MENKKKLTQFVKKQREDELIKKTLIEEVLLEYKREKSRLSLLDQKVSHFTRGKKVILTNCPR